MAGRTDKQAAALFALSVLLGGRSVAGEQKTLTIAAAADLQFALEPVVAAFRAGNPGVEVSLSFGSSGNFFSQITSGAPFDLFLSADAEYPRQLVRDGHSLDGAVFLYGVGRIVLWAPASSNVDVERLGIRSLLDPAVRKVAIANPRHAPYGRAAEAALRSLGVFDAVKDKLVFGENIAQAAQFVETGAAQAGILALSLTRAPTLRGKGRSWEIPETAHPPIEQGGVILRRARSPEAAARFRDVLRGPKGKEALEAFGFVVPGP